METVTKKDIVSEVARLTGYDTQRVQVLVDAMFGCISQGLARDGEIEIRNFGVFKVKSIPQRQDRNLKTGEVVTVPAKKQIHFEPGKQMQTLINREKRPARPEPLG